MSEPVTLTVGIPTFLRDSVLLDTIRQLLSQAAPAEEIIVIDQTPSHDKETEMVLGNYEERGLIRRILQEQPSLAKANNRILAESRCRVVLFVDDDVRISPGFLDAHRRNYLQPQVDLVAGGVLGEGHARRCGADLENSAVPIEDVRNQLKGCNMSVLRDSAIKVGGFDESFVGPAHGNEIDLALRLRSATGREQVFDSTAWLVHLQTPTGGCRVSVRQNATWREWERTYNILLFGFRHDWPADTSFLARAFRIGPRRKENILHPWRQPLAWGSFVYAAWLGWHDMRRMRSPFRTPAPGPPERLT